MKLWIFLRDRKWSKITQYLTSSLIVITDFNLLKKDFFRSKILTSINYSLQLSAIRQHVYSWLFLSLKIGIFIVSMWKLSIYIVILSYASPPVRKLHSHSDIISQLYKPTFLATCLIAVLQPSEYSVVATTRHKV